MKIQTVAVNSISQDPANLRKHGERNIDAIVASLRKFGQQHPIVIDNKGIILSGNGRYMAAVKLGWQEIEVVESSLTGSSATAYAIADNRTAELAEWDTTALAETLRALQSEEFDTDAAGYSESEIDALVEGLGSEFLAGDKEIIEDAIPEPPVDPITKAGDLWILGEHRLLCGDSTNADDVARLMGENHIEVIITDPPYGMSFQSNYRSTKHKEIDGDSTPELLQYTASITAKHSSYIWCRWDNITDIPKPKSLITWVKNNWSMGDLKHEHARQTEVCAFYPGNLHVFPDGRPSDVVKHDRTGNDLHPTQKPVSLIAELIGWTIGTVYDPFLGSGTTLIAAEQLNRKCFGMEISPQYCDVIVKRWENLTGMVAVREPHLTTGK